jgi:hypothetical protein
VVVLASVLTAIAGLVVARHRIPLPVRERHTAAIGTIYAAVYVLFSLSEQLRLTRDPSSHSQVSSQALLRVAAQGPPLATDALHFIASLSCK